MMQITWQALGQLFVLAIPIACISRTVVFEEVFREPREWCKNKSSTCNSLMKRKFFYLFTCEYCFSHWVTLAFLVLAAKGEGPGFRMLFSDWRGTVIAFFSLVLVTNFYLSLYARLKIDITSEKKAIEVKEKEAEHLQIKIDSEEFQAQKVSRRHSVTGGQGDGVQLSELVE